MAGTDHYNPHRHNDGCPSGDYNCKLSHSLEVRLSTLETNVKNLIGTYTPLIPLTDRIRENISTVAEMSTHSKNHITSILDRLLKLEENSHSLSMNLNTLRNNVISSHKSNKYYADNVSKLLEEHQIIIKILQNEEVCRRVTTSELDTVKQDRDELYTKNEAMQKELDKLRTDFTVEVSTRAASEATTRRIFTVAGGIVTLICTIISIVVPFIIR